MSKTIVKLTDDKYLDSTSAMYNENLLSDTIDEINDTISEVDTNIKNLLTTQEVTNSITVAGSSRTYTTFTPTVPDGYSLLISYVKSNAYTAELYSTIIQTYSDGRTVINTFNSGSSSLTKDIIVKFIFIKDF